MNREKEIEVAWMAKAVHSDYKYDEKSFKEGVAWADKHPAYFKGQTDKMQEHEREFTVEWFNEHDEHPCYADAIAWAEKRMIERAKEWLNEELKHYTPFVSIVDRKPFIDKLASWMVE